MSRNGGTGLSPMACSQSRRHVNEGHTLRSTVGWFYLQGKLAWRPIMRSECLRFVDSRSAG